jgi:endoglucanase
MSWCRSVWIRVRVLIACEFSRPESRAIYAFLPHGLFSLSIRRHLPDPPPSIDIHNYGRWWNGIIGQDGPSAAILAQTWSQIASHWKAQPRIVFGTMNEPHDSDGASDFDMSTWASTLQTVVTAIREAGATAQMILLSPTNWANAMSFPDRAEALLSVKNPDGGVENLLFELHQYFDKEGGKNTFCNDALASGFGELAGFLREHERQAFIGELGAGNGQDCVEIVCDVLDVLNNNADVFVGWTSWAAGNWWADYELTQVPTGGQDVGIVKSCFAPKFKASKSG